MKRLTFLALFLWMLPSAGQAQLAENLGFFAPDEPLILHHESGESGYALSAGFTANDRWTGVRAGMNYPFAGFLEAGLAIGQYWASDDYGYPYGYSIGWFSRGHHLESLNTTTLSPSLHATLPAGDLFLTAGAAYHVQLTRADFEDRAYNSQTGETTIHDQASVRLDGHYAELGATIHTRYRLSQRMRLSVSSGYRYVSGKSHYRGDDYTILSNSSDANYREGVLLFGASLSLRLASGNGLVISPQAAFEPEPSFIIGEGFRSAGVSMQYLLILD